MSVLDVTGGIASAVSAVFGAISKGIAFASQWMRKRQDDQLRQDGQTEQKAADLQASLTTSNAVAKATVDAPTDAEGVAKAADEGKF